MGLVGAGTNNSRVAGLLRTLATFYRGEAGHLFVVRIAQGLLHMGKGLLTLSPFHSDRLLLSPVALGGVLSAVLLFLDAKATVHGKYHFLLYSLAAAMNPRWCITVDEAGAEVKVDVRVGTAVETVGQAGRPKSITGFQTHTTPVLMGVKDRAELPDDAYTPLTNVTEGVVVLRPNPAAKEKKTKPAAGGGAGAGGK
jgi:26S proteasome regulatory subunit N1